MRRWRCQTSPQLWGDVCIPGKLLSVERWPFHAEPPVTKPDPCPALPQSAPYTFTLCDWISNLSLRVLWGACCLLGGDRPSHRSSIAHRITYWARVAITQGQTPTVPPSKLASRSQAPTYPKHVAQTPISNCKSLLQSFRPVAGNPIFTGTVAYQSLVETVPKSLRLSAGRNFTRQGFTLGTARLAAATGGHHTFALPLSDFLLTFQHRAGRRVTPSYIPRFGQRAVLLINKAVGLIHCG